MASKLQINCEIEILQKNGIPQDIIQLIMSEKYPDQFNKDDIINEMQAENDFIYNEMVKKGFRPMQEILSNNMLDGYQSETEAETESKEEQDADTKAVTEANQCSNR